MRAAIAEMAKAYQEDCVKFLRSLVAIPSESGREGNAIACMRSEMVRLGYDEVFVDRFGNVIGRIGDGRTKLLFDAHVDTVGIGDASAWKIDPYKGTVSGGKVYGRGSADNKGGAAGAVYAGRIIKDLDLASDCAIYVVGSTLAEECEGLAYKAIVEIERIRPDYIVLTECTGMKIARGHRGRTEIKLTIKGKASHAALPERGENAVYESRRVIAEVEALNGVLKGDKFVGKGTIAITKIECATASLTSVPDECIIYVDRRLSEGESKQDALLEMKQLLTRAKVRGKVEILRFDLPTYTGFRVPSEKYFPSWSLPEKHPLLVAATETHEDVFGRPGVIDKWSFSTHGVYTMGVAKIPTIGFGPSDETHAHSVDDHVPIADLTRAVMFYAALPLHVPKKR